MTGKMTFAACLLLAAFLFCPMPGQEATVEEVPLVLRTYPYSDPSPLANIGRIYPYFRWDGYTSRGEDREWRMVVLENPYLRVLATPQIGGKVWGAAEKASGKPFIYWNPVVKFRDIALRGPWTSGGIEFNFGIIGHTPAGSFPVDYIVCRERDGSATMVVGGLDLASRTEWRTTVRLPRDQAVLETSSFWFNPTPLRQSAYNWTTAAAEAKEDLKLYIPGSHYIGHSGDSHTWPRNEQGRDLSRYAENNFGGSKSYHVLGEYADWFGGYYEKDDFGWGHWAPYDDRPGKKIWIWALSREGEIWHDLLTDPPARQYIEMQTGLQHSQANDQSSRTPFKHAYLEPYGETHWNELWFPVKSIGGLAAASPHGVLNVKSDGGRTVVAVLALRAIDDDLVLESGGKRLLSKRLKLAPMQTAEVAVEEAGAKNDLNVDLGNGKLVYCAVNERENLLHRPLAMPDAFAWDSAEGLFIAAEEAHRQRDYAAAMVKYRACLAREASHLRALTRIAELYYRQGLFHLALKTCREALAIDTYDAGANYYCGLASRKLGFFADAKDSFGWAARSREYHSAAYTELAATLIQENDWNSVPAYATRASHGNVANLRAWQIMALAYRQGGRREPAQEILDTIAQYDPLNHFVRYERYLWDPRPETLQAFAAPIRNELPHETYLELAHFYAALGLTREATGLLEKAPPQPMVLLTLAFLLQADKAKSDLYLKSALSSPCELVFPFRTEEIPILELACEKSYHWKPKYYLALLLWSLSRSNEAGLRFGQCGSNPDSACFYLNRARFLQAAGNGPEQEADLKRALRLDPRQWRTPHLLCQLYLDSGRFDEAMRTGSAALRSFPGQGALTLDTAKAMLACDRPGQARELLARTDILPFEGARGGRDLWRLANLLLAAENLRAGRPDASLKFAADARLWPEHLGAGRPYVTDERIEDFLAGRVEEKKGNHAAASAHYQKIVAFTSGQKPGWGASTLVSALAQKKFAQADAADTLMSEWGKKAAIGDPVFAWAQAIYKNEGPAAAAIFATGEKDKTRLPWLRAHGDLDFLALFSILASD